MDEHLRGYIEELFAEAPSSRRAVEMKEEILQNTLDRYYDLLAEGKSETAAFNIAVAGIGDLTELIESLRDNAGFHYSQEELRRSRQRSAIFLAVAVMLYILSVVPCILFPGLAGVSCMFVLIAAATGLVIYNAKTKFLYRRQDDTIVEEFKEWKEKKEEQKSVKGSILSAIWMLTLVLYFVLSFSTGAWYITWVLFLVAGAVQNIVRACFDLRRGGNRYEP